MPFVTGGHNVTVGFEGAGEKTINLNKDLTWANNYAKMYPAGAARMIEASATLPLASTPNNLYTLVLKPLQPGIVLYKVVVDNGGYEQTWLKMAESPYRRE